jgi:hypothetical protein
MSYWFLLLIQICLAQDLGFLSPADPNRTAVSAEGLYMAKPQNGPAIDEQKGSVAVPVYSTPEKGFALTARGSRSHLSEPLYFGGNNVLVPEEFGAADFGFAWSKASPSGNRFSASATYGNAGTRLFSGEGKSIFGANLFWQRKKEEHSWFYFLSYSNNRAVLNNVPVPGFAYAKMTRSYTAAVGLPFAFVNWRPGAFNLIVMVSPFSAGTDLAYGFWGPLSAFVGAGWTPRSYIIVTGSEDRLMVDEKNAIGGLRMNFGKGGTASIAYVHGFGRKFKYGKSLFDEDVETLEIGDASGVQLKTRFSF